MKKITICLTAIALCLGMNAMSQTNVFDNVIATSADHTYLEAALIQEGLDVTLRNNSATLTVFAPTDLAFDNLVAGLGIDIPTLLGLPNLTDILTYHVLGTVVPASGVSNGAVVQPLSPTNTLKLTLTSAGSVFVNQAQVTTPDLSADNGVVHVLGGVLLPIETAIDVAIDNLFTSLTAAVIEAELIPALTDPLTELTVFAQTNQAFDDLAAALGTDLNGVLAHPQLVDILLYHVVSGTVLSGDLANGSVPTLNGQSVVVDLSSGVMINSSNVTIPDLVTGNGVVHAIDAVLVPSLADLDEGQNLDFNVYPNPASDNIKIDAMNNTYDQAVIFDLNGRVILESSIENGKSIDISSIENGTYILGLSSNGQLITQKLQIF